MAFFLRLQVPIKKKIERKKSLLESELMTSNLYSLADIERTLAISSSSQKLAPGLNVTTQFSLHTFVLVEYVF